MKAQKLKKIAAGIYIYKSYEIRCHGYYPPDRCIVWEAINLETDTGDFRGYTLKEVIELIDEYCE